ncbi:glucoside xylosyltransferase 2 isoform X2 [Cygnus atratus]|uniref:glucoside xylosyltransferase 2 isoform X2 n=1 Tax=Cygnus atratus TaxID=8868 RepID=UPI0015D6064C|nr:glucoside xylosyltransferase 2 isoform X2 [Cygnus atratus]
MKSHLREGLVVKPKPGEQKHSKEPSSLQCMHLAVVACGDRLEETLIMLKSAVLFSNRRLCFHIFSEDSLKPEFEKKLQEWPSSYAKKFEYNIYPITFSVGNAQEWKKLFKPCAAQRLFLPVILKDVDSLLYVDTDVLFLRPIDDIWHILKEFNSTQLAAMAPEHEIPKIGWYSRFARHPYYGTTGVNSGVMLMNLTRIRNTQFKNSMIPSGLTWEEMLYPLYQKYKNYITWGDQDLLNIIFYFNPECLYVFPCQWNYRPDHCMYGSNCKGAEEEGVSILHGNRGVYHDDKQPTFKALYEVIRDKRWYATENLCSVPRLGDRMLAVTSAFGIARSPGHRKVTAWHFPSWRRCYIIFRKNCVMFATAIKMYEVYALTWRRLFIQYQLAGRMGEFPPLSFF